MRRRSVHHTDEPVPWHATREKLALARALRRGSTEGERLLWERIRRRQIGYRFRRQHIIAGYIVDFYCPAVFLAIEVDGPHHEFQLAADRIRDAHLAELGVVVRRFPLAELDRNLTSVVEKITETCARLASLRHRR